MKKLISIVAVLFLLSFGGTLLADTVLLQYTGVLSPWTQVNINAPNLSANPIGAEAGVYQLSIDFDGANPFNGQTVLGYCIDPAYSSTSILEYDIIPVPVDNAFYQAAAYLMATYGTPSTTQAQDIQSAIWIVVEGIQVITPSANASAYALEAQAAVTGGWLAPGWISLAMNPEGGLPGQGAQDYIIRTPEPASLLLLGLGLFGVGLVGRKKRS